MWCGHNEPMAIENDPSMWGEPKALRRMALRAAAAQELPTWNKTVLDRSVKRALEKADGTRPVIAHSGVLPHPPQLDGTDSHLYFGWYHGHERDFPGLPPRPARGWRGSSPSSAPRPCRRAPTSASRSAGPTSTGSGSAAPTRCSEPLFDRHVPPADHATFDEWRAATQAYQAVVVRRHIEALRRIKYRPTGGFAQFCFADGHPAVTWSVLGHDRAPKAAYDALREACQPVIVVADRLPEQVTAGQALALDVHVVSDLRAQIDDAKVTARLAVDGRQPHLALARRHPRRRVPARRHRADRRARRARAARARAPLPARRPAGGQPLRGDDHPLIPGDPQARSRFGLDGDDDSNARPPLRSTPAPPAGAVARGVLPLGRRQEVGDGDHRARC